jgi:hypothetical protein
MTITLSDAGKTTFWIREQFENAQIPIRSTPSSRKRAKHRNSDARSFSETMHNCLQVQEERIAHCVAWNRQGSSASASKCGTWDYDYSVREINICEKSAAKEEPMGNIGEV